MKEDNLTKRIQKNVLLREYTTFKIGGPARYFFQAKKDKEIITAVNWAKRKNLPFFILGGGSNVLIADEGFDGLVIKIKNLKETLGGAWSRVSSKIKNDNIKFKAICVEAGVKLADLVNFSLKESLTGFEWAAGIPGTIGGAVFGNAGAFGKSIEDVIREVKVFDVSKSIIKHYKLSDCGFSYKDSIFKKNKNLIILSCVLRLERGNRLESERKMKYFIDYREKNHPLKFPSAGCIYKNLKFEIKNQKLLEEFPELKEFNEKGIVPAGFLIEKCGLRGKKIGAAQVSQKHANFIVNVDGATSKDVLRLIDLVKKTVKKRFDIELEEELSIFPKTTSRR